MVDAANSWYNSPKLCYATTRYLILAGLRIAKQEPAASQRFLIFHGKCATNSLF